MSHTKTLNTEEMHTLSSTFLSARLSGKSLEVAPNKLPDSLDDAYAVQAISISNWPDKLVGWKVGLIHPDFREKLGASRLAGPVFAKSLSYLGRSSAADERVKMPVFEGGFAAVEAEFVVEIARDIKPGSVNLDTDDIQDFVANLYVGVEIAGSPVPDINSVGPICVVSDFGNNAGLIVGAPIENWRSIPLKTLSARVSINDSIVGESTAESVPGGPLGAFKFLIELCSNRKITLSAGSYICTGAVTGVHQAEVGAKSTADFGQYGKINVELTRS